MVFWMRNLKFKVFRIAAMFVFSGSVMAATTEYRVVDATGTEVLFAKPPKRIIPLQPSLAELADRIGASLEEIVGVSAYTDFPPLLKVKPSIGPYSKPNLEAIVALKPDLVLAGRDGTPKDTVSRLRKLGIPVVTVATETIAGLRESYPIVGAALGKTAEAERALADFDHEIDALRTRAKMRPKLRVMLQVGEDPLVIAGGKTFLNEGLEILGCRNAYPDPNHTYPRVSVEDVLKTDPEAIILIAMGADVASFERAEKRWKSYPKLAATKWNRVILLHSDSLVRPGPRFPAGLVQLERTLFAPGRGHW
jgi:iron complex transport system substrate-binding protein